MINSTSLGDMYSRLNIEPFGFPELSAPEKYASITLNDEFLHEAGYDAYITGMISVTYNTNCKVPDPDIWLIKKELGLSFILMVGLVFGEKLSRDDWDSNSVQPYILMDNVFN